MVRTELEVVREENPYTERKQFPNIFCANVSAWKYILSLGVYEKRNIIDCRLKVTIMQTSGLHTEAYVCARDRNLIILDEHVREYFKKNII